MPNKTRTSIGFGVSIPEEAYARTEKLRGYMSRSKFILMALDAFAETNVNNKPLSFQVSRPRKTEAIMPTPIKRSTDNGTQ